MIIQRNMQMAKKIAKFNQQYKHLMVAIGALHLHGNDSVIEQLKKYGYVIKE